MSPFPPVGPRRSGSASYPTVDQVERTEVLARLPARWAGRLSLAAALLALAGCRGFLIYSPDDDDDTEDTAVVWDTGGLDGMVAEEFWHHVTEDEAWAAVEAALHERGYETLREIRTTVDDQGQLHLEARVLDRDGEELLVGFVEGEMASFRNDGVNSTHAWSCAVLPAEDGSCTVVACGDEAADAAEDACAALGAFPWGEYWSWDPNPDHEWVLESSVDRLLTWARERGLVE